MSKPKNDQDSQPKVYYCSFAQCDFFTFHRGSLPRHELQHAKNKEDLKLKCPKCNFTALQASNLEDHINIHDDLRPWKCSFKGCKYAANNRGSLTRHENNRRVHNERTRTFDPERVDQLRRARRSTSRSTSSTGSDGSRRCDTSCTPSTTSSPVDSSPPSNFRRSASRSTSSTQSNGSRRRGRYTPYTPPTTSSSVDSSAPPPFSLSDLDASKIAPQSQTYSPEMFSHLPLLNASYIAPQTRMDGAPFNPWFLAMPEAQTMQHAQQPMYQQGYPATALPPPLIPEVSMNLSEDILDDFLRRHGEYQPPDASPSAASYGADNSPAFAPTTFNPRLNYASLSAASYSADNSPAFTSTTFSPRLNDASFSMASYRVDNSPAFTPAALNPRLNNPSPSAASYIVDNSPAFTPATLNSRLNDACPPAAFYSADNSPAFTPTTFNPRLYAANAPSHMVSSVNQNIASVRPPSYEHYGHSTGAASSSHDQFTQSSPISQKMVPYPQTFNQNFNYSYAAYPGMQGPCTN